MYEMRCCKKGKGKGEKRTEDGEELSIKPSAKEDGKVQ
jgi:hypothetical protein